MGLLDQSLGASPRARALCHALEAKTLRIEVSGTPLAFDVTARDGSLHIAPHHDPGGTVALRLSAGPVTLLRLAGADAESLIRSGAARLEGDADTARQFQELASHLRPDLEALVAQRTGPLSAHLLLRGARAGFAWGRDAWRSAVLNTSEYLAHESADLVPRAENEQFVRQVEQLREQIERIEARLLQLDARVGSAREAHAS